MFIFSILFPVMNPVRRETILCCFVSFEKSELPSLYGLLAKRTPYWSGYVKASMLTASRSTPTIGWLSTPILPRNYTTTKYRKALFPPYHEDLATYR